MAIRTSTFVLIGAGGAGFLLADTLVSASPAQRAAVKFGGLAIGVLGVFRLLEDLKSSGGILGAVGSALVPIGPAREEVTNEVTLPTPPAPLGLPTTAEARAVSDALERAARVDTVEGLGAGALTSAVTAFVARPAENEELTRSLLSSTVDLELELENNADSPSSAFVELSAFLERLFGDERRRATVGTFNLAPKERRRVTFTWDTGDRHTGLFETGAANVVLSVIVNGKQVSTTEFRVL